MHRRNFIKLGVWATAATTALIGLVPIKSYDGYQAFIDRWTESPQSRVADGQVDAPRRDRGDYSALMRQIFIGWYESIWKAERNLSGLKKSRISQVS